MENQPGQPNAGGNKQSPKFNWARLITTIILLGGIGVLFWWMIFGFGSSLSEVSYSSFQDKIRVNANAENDYKYFKSIKADEFNRTLTITEIYEDSSGKAKSRDFLVRVPLDEIDKMAQLTKTKGATFADQDEFYKSFVLNTTNPKEKWDYATNSPFKLSAPPKSSIWPNLLMSLLPVLLIFGLLFFMFKRSGAMGGGIFDSGKNQAQRIQSTKKFTDIAGQEEVKDEVKEVVDFLKFPAKYKAAGARIPKGILLGGPPGTGKTLLAKATAGEANVPFYFISASNFVEMFAGLGAKRVREMFKDARKSSPAILFIDELDAIGRKRGSSLSGNDEREQTLNQILVEMDGMAENTGLLIMAATNRPDVLDPALLRPGRFDRTITVSNPDIKEREEILKLHAKGKRIENRVNFAKIAKRTPGYSGAQLENIINEAALLSVRERTGVITLEQIDEAIDRVAAGPAKKNRTITPEEMRMVAYHEAGHAVIGLQVAAAEKVQKITIIPRGQAGGYTLMTPKKETYNYKKSELIAKITSFMGGRAAEQIMYGEGEVSTGAHNDIEKATQIARAMVTQYGMSILGPIQYEKPTGPQFLGQNDSSGRYSDALAERIDEAIRQLIQKAEENAIDVINKNKKLLDLIATQLLEKETIVAEEIEYIHKNLKLPPKHEVVQEKKEDKSLESIIEEVESEKTKEIKQKNDEKLEEKPKDEKQEGKRPGTTKKTE